MFAKISTALSQLESSNFVRYIISAVITGSGPCVPLTRSPEGQMTDKFINIQNQNQDHYRTCPKVTCKKKTKLFFKLPKFNEWNAGEWLAQWWEHSPPTNVARDRFPDLTPYVGWVCWFSTLHREVFPWVLRFFPLLKNKHLIWFVLISVDFVDSPISRAHVLG